MQEKDHGVLAYHYFIDEDPLVIHVIEWYESSEAMLDHYAKLDLRGGRAPASSSSSCRRCTTTATRRPEEEAQMAGFGTVHVHRPLVSIEESAAKA